MSFVGIALANQHRVAIAIGTLNEATVCLIGECHLSNQRDDRRVQSAADKRRADEQRKTLHPILDAFHNAFRPFAYANPNATKITSIALIAMNGRMMPPRPYTSRL